MRQNTITLLVLSSILFGVVPGVLQSAEPDHTPYDRILKNYVEGGYFDYEALVENKGDLQRLKNYLKRMAEVNPKQLTTNEQLAYWMNLYNAATLEIVADNYPLNSIRDLDGWVNTVFSKEFIKVGERTLSLDHVEHDIIRERFDEPRIHFALVCAARSCPPLRDEAYLGERLAKQLEDQTITFLESNKNQFLVRDETVHAKLSMILSWYAEDFDGEEGVMEFVDEYLPARKRRLVEEGSYSVDYFEYDWDLNQAPGPYS